MQIETKLPKVGTTIFTVMSQLALEHKAVNLGQGFPDFEPPQNLREALARAMNDGRNQYAPMSGIPKLREQIALATERYYGRRARWPASRSRESPAPGSPPCAPAPAGSSP